MFKEGDRVVCVIADRDYNLQEGRCYTVVLIGYDMLRVAGQYPFFDPRRFRLATPLMEALV